MKRLIILSILCIVPASTWAANPFDFKEPEIVEMERVQLDIIPFRTSTNQNQYRAVRAYLNGVKYRLINLYQNDAISYYIMQDVTIDLDDLAHAMSQYLMQEYYKEIGSSLYDVRRSIRAIDSIRDLHTKIQHTLLASRGRL